MPPRVRRTPFMERVKSMLNPMDMMLWFWEELETRDLASETIGTQAGVILNLVFLVARANYGTGSSNDDIFSDDTGPGWVDWILFPFVWIPIGMSLSNAFLAATRLRKYRLFQANVETKLSTPSARRVKIASDPSQGSPLRYLASLIAPESAETRAHPSRKEDVWELSIWDPLPINTRLYCLFSPLHVLVYMYIFPMASSDSRPSVTLLGTLFFQVLLSYHLWKPASLYEQQAKDHAIIQKEVFHEYDTKFVQPRVHPVVRDVGTQYTFMKGHKEPLETWQVGTPTTLVRQSIHSRQQTRLASPEGPTPIRRNVTDQQMSTPTNPTKQTDTQPSGNYSRPSSSRHSLPPGYVSSSTGSALPASSTTGNLNFGGNMGIHSHHNSPLKKATSLYSINGAAEQSPRNSREMAAYEQNAFEQRRQSSPVRRTPVKPNNHQVNPVPGHERPNPFAPGNRQRSSYDRYPLMR